MSSSSSESFIERFTDALTNDEIHDLLCHLTKRFVILGWYQKEDIETVINKKITDEEWRDVLEKQNKEENILGSSNSIIKEFFGVKDYSLKNFLANLPLKDLKLYAGVSNNSFTKTELASTISQNLEEKKEQNRQNIINSKLEKLRKQLE